MSETICIIDDEPMLTEVLGEALVSTGFKIKIFNQPAEFLTWFADNSSECDLIISDIHMSGVSGYTLCKTVRGTNEIERIPIILVTGGDTTERAMGIEGGADDFMLKPFCLRELLAKIKSLLEIRRESRKIISSLKRASQFLSPNVADLIKSSSEGDASLAPHNADVTILFADLRRFTAFAEVTSPEEVMKVLGDYYSAVGSVALALGGTIGNLSGDGVLVFFNDPNPVRNHRAVAVKAALQTREILLRQRAEWIAKGYDIDFGIGVAQGVSISGQIGFEGYSQYSVISPATNFAARLCKLADNGQILVSRKFLDKLVQGLCVTEPIGTMPIKGIQNGVELFNVVSFNGKTVRPKVVEKTALPQAA